MRYKRYGDNALLVDNKYIESDEYRNKFIGITGKPDIDEKLLDKAKEILKDRSGTLKETLVLLDKSTGDELLTILSNEETQRIKYKPEHEEKIQEIREAGIEIIAIHNHPTGWPPTADDCSTAFFRGYSFGITCGHNGTVYVYYPAGSYVSEEECSQIHDIIAEKCLLEKDIAIILDTWKKILAVFDMRIKERR